MHSSNGKALNELERIIMNTPSGRTVEEAARGEAIKRDVYLDVVYLRRDCRWLAIELINTQKQLACATERQQYWEARARSAEEENAEYEAQIEASNKQEPVGEVTLLMGEKLLSGINRLDAGTKLYLHPQAPVNAIPDIPNEEMIDAGVYALNRGELIFGENKIQIITNIWEDMYEAATQPDNDRSKDGE